MNLSNIIVGIAILAAVGFWLTVKIANAIDEAESIGASREEKKDLAADALMRQQWGEKAAMSSFPKGMQMQILRKKVRP